MPTQGGNSVPWPRVSYQPTPWAGDLDDVPRRHQSKFSGLYEAAIVPPIETARAHLSPEIRAAADEATAEIARFDADMSAGISPLPAILLRSESASSSQIEHLTATARAIASAELGDVSRHNASEIVANSRLMEAAIALAAEPGTTVTLSYRSAGFSRVKPANSTRLKAQVDAGRVRLMLQSQVEGIDEDQVSLRTEDGPVQLRNQAVIVCAGGELPTALLQRVGVHFETKYGSA